MNCEFPRHAWLIPDAHSKTGKRLTFKPPLDITDYADAAEHLQNHILVPCGHCLLCRLERARLWSVRCVHEASLHDRNCFITLTYSPACLPPCASLVKRDLQLFFKRLRKYVSFRYIACGEYGAARGRPHYHACLFGWCPSDLYLVRAKGAPLYSSPFLAKVWGKGLVSVGEVTSASAAYVARYTLKKVASKYQDKFKQPEFLLSSRRPGIGGDWIALHWEQVLHQDKIQLLNGGYSRVPRFYDKYIEKCVDADTFFEYKLKRLKAMQELEISDDESARRVQARIDFFCHAYENKRNEKSCCTGFDSML